MRADQPPTAAKGRGCSADLRKCWDLPLGARTDSRKNKSSWSLYWLQEWRENGWFSVFLYLQLEVAFLHKRLLIVLCPLVVHFGDVQLRLFPWACCSLVCEQKQRIKQQYRLVQYASIRLFKFSFLSSSCIPVVPDTTLSWEKTNHTLTSTATFKFFSFLFWQKFSSEAHSFTQFSLPECCFKKNCYFCLFPNCHKISVCKIVQLIVDSCHEKKGLENSLEQTFADLSTEAVLRPVQCLDHAGHKL